MTTTITTTATAAATAAGVGAVTTGGVEEMLVRQQPVTFTPPEALFKSPEYPSLQIVNPAPGLQVFQPPMTYAEVDYDYHLCPLPRFTHAPTSTSGKAWPTQRKFLDREDTIRGIMGWRKFPSQGLTSLSNHPTLTSVWVPRWDDSFSQELLPESVPPLYHQLDPDDADNVMEEEEGVGEETGVVTLKPEMVSAQFDLIDPSSPSEDQKMPADMFPYGNRMPATNIPVGSHGPVAREKREEELEYFITKKYNRLGSKVKEKVTSLNSLLSDRDMVLK
ncbi:cilia- and flagella-associated protein 221 [Aplysia californica]|uniref:Cilia- and flagella-associated protein 221 n=1 Tax=Aplysia californica TaxID=6500 RepID=A0ABM1A2M8_APLCA|nr:cilia- and flagella-associated protein 221 [Aplysia californica]